MYRTQKINLNHIAWKQRRKKHIHRD